MIQERLSSSWLLLADSLTCDLQERNRCLLHRQLSHTPRWLLIRDVTGCSMTWKVWCLMRDRMNFFLILCSLVYLRRKLKKEGHADQISAMVANLDSNWTGCGQLEQLQKLLCFINWLIVWSSILEGRLDSEQLTESKKILRSGS